MKRNTSIISLVIAGSLTCGCVVPYNPEPPVIAQGTSTAVTEMLTDLATSEATISTTTTPITTTLFTTTTTIPRTTCTTAVTTTIPTDTATTTTTAYITTTQETTTISIETTEVITSEIETIPTDISSGYYPTEYERELLAEVVEHEAGSDWISCYDKAMCVAAIMNRVRQGCWGGTDIYSVLTARGQFAGFYPGYCTARSGAYEAVDYYFAHPEEFSTEITSWTGDGYQNYFT